VVITATARGDEPKRTPCPSYYTVSPTPEREVPWAAAHSDGTPRLTARPSRRGSPSPVWVADPCGRTRGESRRPGRKKSRSSARNPTAPRVLERCACLGMKNPPPLGAKHLDRDLRGRPARPRCLLGARQRRGVDLAPRPCGMPLRDQKQRVDHTDRHRMYSVHLTTSYPEIPMCA